MVGHLNHLEKPHLFPLSSYNTHMHNTDSEHISSLSCFIVQWEQLKGT